MALTFGAHVKADGTGLTTVVCLTREDLLELRDQHPEWHEGALSVLQYPSSVMGFLSHDSAKRAMSSLAFQPPIKIGKDAAGNFLFLDLDTNEDTLPTVQA